MIKTLFKNLFGSDSGHASDAQAGLERQMAAADAGEDAQASIAVRRELLKLQPGRSDLWVSLAEIQRWAGDLREAASSYQRALSAGAPAVQVLLQLGAVHAEFEDFASAEDAFRQLVALDPIHADAWCMLGIVIKDQGRHEEAGQCLETSIRHNPALAAGWFNLGLAQFEQGKLADASQSFLRCVELLRGRPWGSDLVAALEREPMPAFEPKDMGVNEIKLRHDCEQLEYLLARGKLPSPYSRVLDDYRLLLGEISGKVDENTFLAFDPQRHPLVARTYKRPVYIADAPLPTESLINPALNFAEIEERYLAADPNATTLDNLLTPQALESVRLFCRESTIWNNIKPGYLGAYFYDGFCSNLLLRLAWELREHMPRVIRDLPLNMMWGFKCDATLPGLAVHADAAAVNVNFWITEDEANLDPDGGGLLVYEHDAPRDWDFRRFNKEAGKIQDYLDSIGSVPTRYPYRANRALIFDSDLFHATDHPHFRTGYLNRRINITLLYGNRKT
jgi:Flp pilus assembly protein TadD